VRVAVLGLGSAGARHARNLLDLGHEVVGFDPAASGPVGIESAKSSAGAIAQAEAVIVATPSSLHGEQAIAALDHGKHVLVEKPLATTAADAAKVVDAAARTEAVCAVAMNLRFHPGIVELKRLVADGALGAVRFARASFGFDLRLWRPESDYRQGYSARAELGGGIVLDAIHELDYLLWLLGPVASVGAEVAHVSDLEIDVEDLALVLMRFESGAFGSVDLNFFEPAYRRGCTLVGSNAVARWEWERELVTVSRQGEQDQVTRVRYDVGETYRAELVDFLDAASRGGVPRTTAREGLAAVSTAEAVKRSASLGRRVALESV
jgi:predicted dehydrogenase